MKAQINVISGGPAGTVHVFSKPVVSIGRHPECDLQFDPQQDLQVSIRHAELVRAGDRWSVRDLQSSNGTFINGHQITTETQLDTTDQIRLGRKGPLLEFKLVPDGTQDTDKPQPAVPAPAGGQKPPRTTDTGERPPLEVRQSNTEHRVKIEVAKQTRKLRTSLFFLAFLLVGVLGAATWFTDQQRRQQGVRIEALQAQYDSILLASSVTIQDLRGEVDGLADALQRSRIQMRDLTNQLERAQASGDAARVATLTAQLSTVRSELAQRQSAARIDHTAINDANGLAVGMVRVQYTSGEIVTGTAFAIDPNGTMVTNRHVVAGPSGTRRIRQMGVQFANSEQFFPAEIVRVAQGDSVDLALIRVRVGSAVPTIAGINRRSDTIPVGAPVAMIGFPLGDDLPMAMGRTRPLASATLTAALVSKNIPGQIQLQGFGAPGGSGSPILDANGELIGVEYGGNADVQLVVGVRADALLQFLNSN